MPLPILHTASVTTTETLIRLFHKLQLHWSQHLAEEIHLSVGSAFANRSMSNVKDANVLLDASLADGVSPVDALKMVSAHYEQLGTRCQSWVINPSANKEMVLPLTEHLQKSGFMLRAYEIRYLDKMNSVGGREIAGAKIIPARAGFRQMQTLVEQQYQSCDPATGRQLAQAAMLHLDDPHYDALLAINGGAGIARIGVLSAGEIGLIEPLFVAQTCRDGGVGSAMLSRALEICARSLFKHVFISCRANNEAALSLYGRFGFKKIGEYVYFDAPE